MRTTLNDSTCRRRGFVGNAFRHHVGVLFLVVVMASYLPSCGPSSESVKPGTGTKENLYQRGHQLFLLRDLDSAAAVLGRASAMDTGYIPPVTDLASLFYDLGMKEPENSPGRAAHLKTARNYFARIEARGGAESEVYERLCEISVLLEDDGGFLRYARRNAEKYPFDRQYFNLGLAYFNVGDFSNVVKTQKEATEKFKQSPYIGSFYRQLGRAYMKQDRHQTAERTFESGVQIVDQRMGELKKAGTEHKSTDAYRRLLDDKIGMLTSLKWLHYTYKEAEKLERVERQLKEAEQSR